MTEKEFMTGLYERGLKLLDMIMKRGLEVSLLTAFALLLLWGYLEQRAEINDVRRDGKAEITIVKREYKAAIDSVGRDLRICMESKADLQSQVGALKGELDVIKKFLLKTTGLKK